MNRMLASVAIGLIIAEIMENYHAMKEVVQWISDVARISWDIFCMAPVTCILLLIIFIAFIPVYRNFWKSIDKARDHIILR